MTETYPSGAVPTETILDRLPPIPPDPDFAHRRASYAAHCIDPTLQESNAELQSRTPSLERRMAVSEIMTHGTLNGHEVDFIEGARNASHLGAQRRWMAALSLQHPEHAQALAENDIAGFHATSSFALAGLIEDGALFSGRHMQENGGYSPSGAQDSSAKGQPDLSFGTLDATQTNINAWAGGSRRYTNEEIVAELEEDIRTAQSELTGGVVQVGSAAHKAYTNILRNSERALEDFQANPNSLRATMMRIRFPVAVGVTRAFVRKAEDARTSGHLHIGQSDFGEFRPAASEIPITETPVVLVPRDMIAGTQELLENFGHHGVRILPMEDFDVWSQGAPNQQAA